MSALDFLAGVQPREAATFCQNRYTPRPPKHKWPIFVGSIRNDKGEPASAAVGPNKPLTFTLKGIDHSHPYLGSGASLAETAETFGVGFFAGKGSMSGRVVIPIHNDAGELVAYAGRAIYKTDPKYRLPVPGSASMR